MKTNVTIISTDLNKKILDNYKEYKVIDDNFNSIDLKNYKNVLFYNILSSLNDKEIGKLFSFLNSNEINFINVTNNIEEILYTEYLIIYNNLEIIKAGKTKEIIEEDSKFLKKLGFNNPFIIELSYLLKDYNLVNKVYYDNSSLKGDLWI